MFKEHSKEPNVSGRNRAEPYPLKIITSHNNVGGWVENETMSNQRMLVFRKLVNQLGQTFAPNEKMDGSDNDWTPIIQRGVQWC